MIDKRIILSVRLSFNCLLRKYVTVVTNVPYSSVVTNVPYSLDTGMDELFDVLKKGLAAAVPGI